MSVFDDDLSSILSGAFSSSVSLGTGASLQTTRGIKDSNPLVRGADGAEYQITGVTLRIQTGSLTGLAEDVQLTVDGVAHVIRQITPSVDGRYLTLLLVKVV